MVETTSLGLLLDKVFDDARSDLRNEFVKQGRIGDYDRLKRDFIFHMTDWITDLERLHALEQAPEVWKPRQATHFIIGFLYHVIPHLNAAGRLLLDEVPDPFAQDESARLLARANEGGPKDH